MPFYIGVPEKKDNGYAVVWDASFDFKGEDISTCSTKFLQILYANLNKHELKEFRKLHSTSIDADKFIIL